MQRDRSERRSTDELTGLVHRNVRALIDVRRAFHRGKSLQERAADRITAFTGSMPFVYIHALLFGGWIVVNTGVVPYVKPFDPFPFVMLAMAASVEAIFLSTFVLISQNRMQVLADKRAELDLQINLLAEQELTRLIALVDAIAERLGLPKDQKPNVDALKREVAPEQLLEEIERMQNDARPSRDRAESSSERASAAATRDPS